MKIIKSFESLKDQHITLPYDEDRAIADYRAFYPLACVHSVRVCDPYSINVMLEILETLQKDLQSRKIVLNLD